MISVNLVGNKLSDEGIAVLATVLSDDQLLDLNIAHNGIADTAAIVSILRGARNLRELCLGGNAIGDDGAIEIANALGYHPNIRKIDLSYNNITDKGTEALSELFRQNMSIRSIDLAGNSIGDVGATTLSRGMRENRVLEELGLARNEISDVGAEALAKLLGMQSLPLMHLWLAGNQISAKGILSFGHELRCNSTLRSLDVRFNQIAQEEEVSPMLDVVTGCNTTISHCKLFGYPDDTKRPQVLCNYHTKLNKAGKGFARSRPELLSYVLARQAANPETIDTLYGLLLESPHSWLYSRNDD